MKKWTIVILLAAFVFTSCDDKNDCEGREWEFDNFSIGFTVVDGDGNNLLEDLGEGGFIWDFTVNYKDKDYAYEGNEDTGSPGSLNLRVEKDKEGDNYLAFGEFSPRYNYKNEKFAIDWGDGSDPDEVSFDLFITWENCVPTVHSNYYLNGKEVQLPIRKVLSVTTPN